MPTIVSYPKIHAYKQQENGRSGEGQLWNKKMKRWDDPSFREREQMMGYKIEATEAGHVTICSTSGPGHGWKNNEMVGCI